jgi:methyltransferase
MGWAALVVALVALQRLVELFYARRNEARLRARGGIERGAGHYPLIVLLHGAWLAAVFVFAAKDTAPVWGWLALYLALQAARYWVMTSLGPYWTTRVITLPGARLIRGGPYRFLNHPNYAVVAAEIAVLPLAFGEYRVALFFSALNLALLAWRLRVENAALAARR